MVCATNRQIDEMIQNHELAESIFYNRISAINFKIPPLKERHEDLPGLVSEIRKNIDLKDLKFTENGLLAFK